MKILASILIALLPLQTLAECVKPVQYLQSGDRATCTGYLFSPAKELELRIKNEEYKLLTEQTRLYIQQLEFYKKELEVNDKLIKKQEEKTELWRTATETYSDKYLQLKEKQQSQEYYFFGAGVLATLLTTLSVAQLTK